MKRQGKHTDDEEQTSYDSEHEEVLGGEISPAEGSAPRRKSFARRASARVGELGSKAAKKAASGAKKAAAGVKKAGAKLKSRVKAKYGALKGKFAKMRGRRDLTPAQVADTIVNDQDIWTEGTEAQQNQVNANVRRSFQLFGSLGTLNIIEAALDKADNAAGESTDDSKAANDLVRFIQEELDAAKKELEATRRQNADLQNKLSAQATSRVSDVGSSVGGTQTTSFTAEQIKGMIDQKNKLKDEDLATIMQKLVSIARIRQVHDAIQMKSIVEREVNNFLHGPQTVQLSHTETGQSSAPKQAVEDPLLVSLRKRQAEKAVTLDPKQFEAKLREEREAKLKAQKGQQKPPSMSKKR